MSSTYTDVDGSQDPGAAADWQERVDGWPGVRAYKERIETLLADAGTVLDVGCGPGGDLVTLGIERAIGVDRSQTMCARAVARGARATRADGHALPFRTDAFGGVVADRVLQHVANPEVVLDEMLRILRPDGRIVLADPDQETLVINVPRVDVDLIDRVKAARRDVGYRNGRLVSSLPATLLGRGVVDVTVEPFALCLRDPDDAFGLPGWLTFWRDDSAFTDDEIAAWDRGVVAGRDGGFVYALIYFVVSGIKP